MRKKRRLNQQDRVYEYMKDFTYITRVDAMQDIGVANLTAVISELRKDGIQIETKYIKTKNRYGERIKYAQYYLKEEQK